MTEQFVQADYGNPRHAGDLVWLMNEYARDPMGGGEPLPGAVLERLPEEMAKRPHVFSILAYVDDEPAGLVNCIEGFSTFKCRPLINIHDIVVIERFRGQGLGGRLLEQVEALARERGCCKLTLEVLEGNEGAQKVYRKSGFRAYELDPSKGRALFWEKAL